MNITIESLKEALKIWGLISSGYKAIGNFVRCGEKIKRYDNVISLSSDVMKEELSIGQLIEVKGIMSRFQHCYMPISHCPVVTDRIFGPLEGTLPEYIKYEVSGDNRIPVMIPKGAGIRYYPDLMGVVGAETCYAKLRPSYLPASSIPPINIGREEFIAVGFLYPSDNEGLRTVSSPGTIDNVYHINSNDRGIPILFKNMSDLRKWEENYVTVSGIVCEAPLELLYQFRHLPESIRSEVTSLFYSPFKQGVRSFCILVQEVGIEECLPSQNERIVRLFVEGHYEDLPERLTKLWAYQDDMHSSLKSIANGKAIANFNLPSKGVFSITAGDIVVTVKEPAFVGYYIDVPILTDYPQKLNNLKSAFDTMNKTFKGLISDEFKQNADFQLDFLFDFDLDEQFGGNLLDSKSAIQASRDGNLNIIRNWLRQK